MVLLWVSEINVLNGLKIMKHNYVSNYVSFIMIYYQAVNPPPSALFAGSGSLLEPIPIPMLIFVVSFTFEYGFALDKFIMLVVDAFCVGICVGNIDDVLFVLLCAELEFVPKDAEELLVPLNSNIC
jgi:hypothetical protein